jgi:hypothetical protein
MRQPVFEPHPGDLDRKVADCFPDHQEQARKVLGRYDAASASAAPDRVKLAALYLSDGDLVALDELVDVAILDYRDVIGPAEYRRYIALPMNADEADRQVAIRADEERYLGWIGR